MSSADQFHDSDVRERTELKLQILKLYLEPWRRIVKSVARRFQQEEIWFVDLFAGQGELSDGSLGSALLAAQTSLAALNDDPGIKLCVYACEERRLRFDALSAGLEAFKHQGIHAVSKHGKWHRYASDIASHVRNKPVLVFVDPIGFRDIRIYDLVPVARQAKTIDVLVKLEDSYVERFAAEDRGALDEALGHSRWKDSFPWNGTSAEKSGFIAQEFCNVMQSRFSRPGRTVRAKHYQLESRNLVRPVRFSMAMASGHMLGLRLFGDGVAKAVARSGADATEGVPIELFDQRTPPERRLDQIKELMLRCLTEAKISRPNAREVHYDRIWEYVVLNWQHPVEQPEITSAVRSLHLEDGKIRKAGHTPRGHTRDSFFID